MGRPVILGNGSLTVGLDELGLVHDFYYPYVGLDNLTTARSSQHKIGVWVDNHFSWVDNQADWTVKVNFRPDALISEIHYANQEYSIELVLNDFVDSEYNVFARRISVNNLSDSPKEVRLFMHQVFEISRSGRADTAQYVPDANYILDYKGRCSMLIYGQSESGDSFDQYAVGNYGIEGKEGTFRDAEDGELSNSPVEHGGVDSVVRFRLSIEAHSSDIVNYWIVAADSQYSAEKIHDVYISQGLAKRLSSTEAYWQNWLSIAEPSLKQIDESYQELINKSLMMIKVHVDKRGGIIASCDSSIYNYGRDYYSYVWPRDGCYAIWPLIRLGYKEEAKKFFEFCRDILSVDGYLMHKYQPDRAIGSTWHPLIHNRRKELAIQEDETASVIYMLGEYYASTKDDDFVFSLYNTLIQPAANFMARFIDKETNLPHASYDLWEQKFLTNTYTVAVVYQSLLVAAEFADQFNFPDDSVRWKEAANTIASAGSRLFNEDRQYLIKGFILEPDGQITPDGTLDVSSLYGVFMYNFKAIDEDKIRATAHAIEQTLLDRSPSGGTPRYEHDHYFESHAEYMGNPWHVTTLWMAQYYIRTNNQAKAKQYLDWSNHHAYASGVLSEQVNPETGYSLSVTPLVWSHAEFINTALDYARMTKANRN